METGRVKPGPGGRHPLTPPPPVGSLAQCYYSFQLSRAWGRGLNTHSPAGEGIPSQSSMRKALGGQEVTQTRG